MPTTANGRVQICVLVDRILGDLSKDIARTRYLLCVGLELTLVSEKIVGVWGVSRVEPVFQRRSVTHTQGLGQKFLTGFLRVEKRGEQTRKKAGSKLTGDTVREIPEKKVLPAQSSVR